MAQITSSSHFSKIMIQRHILIVLNGDAFQGASITSDRGDPLPLDLATLADVAPSINAAAIAKISELEATHATSSAEKDALLEACNEDATRSAARISELEAKVAELTPPSEADIITKLNDAFEAFIPADQRGEFAASYAVVRVLIQAGKPDLARAVIVSVGVPPELEEAKAVLLGLF